MRETFTLHVVYNLQLLITAYGLLNIYTAFNLCHVLMVEYQTENCLPVILFEELCMMAFAICRSRATAQAIGMSNFVDKTIVLLNLLLNVLQTFLGNVLYIMKRLQDMKSKGKLIAMFLLIKLSDDLFPRRQSSVSRANSHIIFFIMVQQLPLIAGAQPLSNQSLTITLESSYSDRSNLAHEISIGIPQSVYQIIGISLAAIAGITGISAAIWGPCLPKWWTDRRHVQPVPERDEEDRQRNEIDHGPPSQRTDQIHRRVPNSSWQVGIDDQPSALLNAKTDLADPFDGKEGSRSSCHARSIGEPGDITGTSGSGGAPPDSSTRPFTRIVTEGLGSSVVDHVAAQSVSPDTAQLHTSSNVESVSLDSPVTRARARRPTLHLRSMSASPSDSHSAVSGRILTSYQSYVARLQMNGLINKGNDNGNNDEAGDRNPPRRRQTA
ncbi:hypothetical protein F4860DRAFT_518354 [Xylaria cubensis]|nr:hypothetical protein F4860DRAFT_518354 [Xylaria cubensis]